MPKISKVTRADHEYTIDVDRLTIRDLLAFEKARTSGNVEDVMHYGLVVTLCRPRTKVNGVLLCKSFPKGRINK